MKRTQRVDPLPKTWRGNGTDTRDEVPRDPCEGEPPPARSDGWGDMSWLEGP